MTETDVLSESYYDLRKHPPTQLTSPVHRYNVNQSVMVQPGSGFEVAPSIPNAVIKLKKDRIISTGVHMARPFKKQADLVNLQTQGVDGVEHFGTSTFRPI